MSIGSVFLIDPTLKPQMAKPQDEDYTDAKILFYFPPSQDIHERRKQAGISEGIVNFFMPFSRDDSPIECIATSKFTHVMKQVEKNMWLNMVVEHPDTLYGKGESDQQTASDVDGETIANAKFTYSQFTEQDSRIFYLLLEQFYSYLRLFHGSLIEQVETHTKAGTLDLF